MDDIIDVKLLRERLGWTQERLAAELGLDRSTVSRIESGQPPSGPTLILLRRLTQDLASGATRERDESAPSDSRDPSTDTTGNAA